MEFKNNPDSSMPLWIEHPVKNRRDWEKIRWRLQPDSKSRLVKVRKFAEKVEKGRNVITLLSKEPPTAFYI